MHYLKDSYITNDKLFYKLDIDPLLLDVVQAMSLGLIINQAVTNSIKYAFPGNADGEIKISIKKENNLVKMLVANNGIGLNSHFNNEKSGSLGLKLIEGPSGSINSDLDIENCNVTKITITFNPDYYSTLKALEKVEIN